MELHATAGHQSDLTWQHACSDCAHPTTKGGVDIFEAPDAETAARVVMIVRSFGHGQTETWTAVPWDRFEHLISGITIAA